MWHGPWWCAPCGVFRPDSNPAARPAAYPETLVVARLIPVQPRPNTGYAGPSRHLHQNLLCIATWVEQAVEASRNNVIHLDDIAERLLNGKTPR